MAAGILTFPAICPGNDRGAIGTGETVVSQVYLHPDEIPGTGDLTVAFTAMWESGTYPTTWRLRFGGSYVNVVTQVPAADGTVIASGTSPASAGPFTVTSSCSRPNGPGIYQVTAQAAGNSNTLGTSTVTLR